MRGIEEKIAFQAASKPAKPRNRSSRKKKKKKTAAQVEEQVRNCEELSDELEIQ